MNSDLWELAKDLFIQASAMEGSVREAFLEDGCRGRTDLREEVDSLLDAHGVPSAILDRPATDYVTAEVDYQVPGCVGIITQVR